MLCRCRLLHSANSSLVHAVHGYANTCAQELFHGFSSKTSLDHIGLMRDAGISVSAPQIKEALKKTKDQSSKDKAKQTTTLQPKTSKTKKSARVI